MDVTKEPEALAVADVLSLIINTLPALTRWLQCDRAHSWPAAGKAFGELRMRHPNTRGFLIDPDQDYFLADALNTFATENYPPLQGE